MSFDPAKPRAEAIRLARTDQLEKNEYMTSRWDAHGAFIAGAAFQYDQMVQENNRLRMLVADVLHGWLPEEAGPAFDWDQWADLAFREVGENGSAGKSTV